MQKHVNLVDLVKSFPTNILLQNLASIQKRTSPVKFAHLAEKSENGSISNLSTKVTANFLSRARDRLEQAVEPVLGALERGELAFGPAAVAFVDLAVALRDLVCFLDYHQCYGSE